MKLYVENIGKIERAEIEIGGLTVIAGENDTGKSTIGKVLFSMIKYNKDLLKGFYSEFKENILRFGKAKGEIKFENEIINISKKLDKYSVKSNECKIFNNYLDITLTDSIELELLKIKMEETKYSNNLIHIPETKTSYKAVNLSEIIPHKIDLLNKVKNGLLKYENEQDFSKIKNFELLEKISEIVGGYWDYSERTNEFYFQKNENSSEYYSSSNIASGVKNFLIIEALIKGGYIDADKPLIIDEPEVHLHPEWQVKYAEVLIELVKNNIPVVVTSHSGDFLQALMNLVKEDQKLINKTSISRAYKSENGNSIVDNGGFNVEKNEKLLGQIYDDLTAPSWRIINGD